MPCANPLTYISKLHPLAFIIPYLSLSANPLYRHVCMHFRDVCQSRLSSSMRFKPAPRAGEGNWDVVVSCSCFLLHAESLNNLTVCVAAALLSLGRPDRSLPNLMTAHTIMVPAFSQGAHKKHQGYRRYIYGILAYVFPRWVKRRLFAVRQCTELTTEVVRNKYNQSRRTLSSWGWESRGYAKK